MKKQHKGSSFVLNTDCVTLIRTMRSTITARKRWHIACATIYSLRAFLSIVKDNLNTSQPYSILENEPVSPQSSSLSIEPTRLIKIVRDKSLHALHALGGFHNIASSLKANLEGGILGSNDDVYRRKEMYGSNTYIRPPPKGFFYFVWTAFKDPTLIILLVAATLSLGFGIKEEGLKEGWYEGGSIFVAVFLVVFVSAISNFKQERQFSKLSKISDNILISVVRDSRPQQVSIFDIVVGDVVKLKIGDQIPADGLFIDGYSLLIDESSMTGESDHVDVNSTTNPFLHSGSKVGDGYGRMLVTGVGTNTAWGEMMSSINRDVSEETPLQVRLNGLTSSIGKVGLLVALLVLVVLLVRYFTGNTHDEHGNVAYTKGKTSVNSIMNSVVRIISTAVTIVVVAIPEGLPLAVTLTLAYSMKRMMADQAMVRKLSACETMGSATVILLGIVGLKDPCRPEVKNAVEIVNVAALVINFVAAVSAGEVPLTAVQLLWVNLIMDTLGALALATERPTKELIDKPPVGRTAPLITNIMWRNLLCQAFYQISILLILQFKGTSIFNVNTEVKNTLIFNTFVLCQVFNEFNSRRMEKQNIFEGLHKTPLFIGIIVITIILQVVMVEFLKKFADTVNLNWQQWGACIIMAFISWPIGFTVKLIPVPEEPLFTIIARSITRVKKIVL